MYFKLSVQFLKSIVHKFPPIKLYNEMPCPAPSLLGPAGGAVLWQPRTGLRCVPPGRIIRSGCATVSRNYRPILMTLISIDCKRSRRASRPSCPPSITKIVKARTSISIRSPLGNPYRRKRSSSSLSSRHWARNPYCF